MSSPKTLSRPTVASLVVNDNLRGIAWMVLAMATFALEDAFLKRVSRELPVGQLLMMFGIGGAAVFAVGRLPSSTPLFIPEVWSRTMLVRAAFETVGRLFYVLALALTPLSSATAILQATPVLVVLGASLFFGERVGVVRWIAIAAGLAGVMIILRPASSDFSLLSLVTVVGMIGFAGRDLVSRAVPSALGTRHLGFYGFLAVVVAGAVYAVWEMRPFVWPGSAVWFVLACAVLTGVLAYASLMKAMRTGDIATVTPFRYTRLLFGVGLGILMFNEQVDTLTMVGCAVIVLAGLLIALHNRTRSVKT